MSERVIRDNHKTRDIKPNQIEEAKTMMDEIGPDGYVEAECVAAEAHGTFAVQRFTPDPNADG